MDERAMPGRLIIAEAEADPAAQPPDWFAVWRLLAPWLGYVLIGAAAILGLFTASGAPDNATYDAGMVTFGLAVCLIALRLKAQMDGRYIGLILPLVAEDPDALLLHLAILVAFAIGGLLVTAGTEGVFHVAGLAFFCVCGLLVFYEVKRYFDRREARTRPPS